MIIPRILVNLNGGVEKSIDRSKKVNPKIENAIIYWEFGKSTRWIAKKLGVAQSTVHGWVKHTKKGILSEKIALDTEITA